VAKKKLRPLLLPRLLLLLLPPLLLHRLRPLKPSQLKLHQLLLLPRLLLRPLKPSQLKLHQLLLLPRLLLRPLKPRSNSFADLRKTRLRPRFFCHLIFESKKSGRKKPGNSGFFCNSGVAPTSFTEAAAGVAKVFFSLYQTCLRHLPE
jgi:hypothetical protein